MKRIATLLAFTFISISVFGQFNLVEIHSNSAKQQGYGHVLAVMPGGDVMLLAAGPDDTNYKLYRTDGTKANTKLIMDLKSNAGSKSFYSNSLYFNGKLYISTASDVWVTDGTTAGTIQLTSVGQPAYYAALPEKKFNMVAYNGKVYFFAGTFGGDVFELWETDGTKAGTKTITNWNVADKFQQAKNLLIHNGKMYFTQGGPMRLYESDGTTTGTKLATPANNLGYAISGYMIAYQGTLYMNAVNGDDYPDAGREFFKFNGSTLELVKDIFPGKNSGQPNNSDPFEFTVSSNGKLYFVAITANPIKAGLFISDGSASGTTLLKETTAGIDIIGDLHGKILFTYNDATAGRELWITDGTVAGTQMVTDINPSGSGIPYEKPLWEDDASHEKRFMQNHFIYKDKYYFAGDDGVHGIEPWVTDGTAGGTKMIGEIGVNPTSTASSKLSWIFVNDDKLWVTAGDGTNEGELYVHYIYPLSIDVATEHDQTFDIIPNPSNGSFEVQLSSNDFLHGELHITDITGKEVYSQSIHTKNVTITLPTGSTKGIYLLSIQLDGHQLNKKLDIY